MSRSMFRATVGVVALLGFVSTPALADDEKKPKKSEEKKETKPRRSNPMGDRFAKQATEMLTRELDLSPTQQVEVQKIMADTMAEAWGKIAEFYMMRGGDMNDPEAQKKARKAFEDVRVLLSNRISKVLTPAQKKEFEVLVERFDQRAQRYEQGQRAWQDPSQLYNPKPQSKQLLMGKAERSLTLTKEETAVIMPRVGRIVDTMHNLYEGRKSRRKDLLAAIQSGANKTEIRERMETIRAAEQFQQLELMAARQKLRELLTIQQEALFVSTGILD